MYTVVIDEAGDVGLENVLPDPSRGPTQYFVASAAIFREHNRGKIEAALRALPFSKNILHCSKLNHYEKIFLSRTMASLPVAFLGVISNKLTLGPYLPEVQKSPTHYYNKAMQYLLERVAIATASFDIPAAKIRFCLEAREQRYDLLLNFIRKIQKNPLHANSIPLRDINVFSITRVNKADDYCLALADMGAHALFSAVRRDFTTHGLSETRYLEELAPRFIAGRNRRIIPFGVRALHSIRDLGLPRRETRFLSEWSNPERRFCRLEC